MPPNAHPGATAPRGSEPPAPSRLLSARPSTETPVDLCLDRMRAELARGAPSVPYAHEPSLLRHAVVDQLPLLDGLEVCESTVHPRSFPPRLSRALRHAGLACHRTNEALTAELGFLLRFVAALSGDPAPRLHLSWGDAGAQSTGDATGRTRLALRQLLVHAPDVGYDGPPRLGRHGRVARAPLTTPGEASGRRGLVAHVTTEQEFVCPDLGLVESRVDPVDVLLVSMPFGLIMQGSLGLGLLKATLPSEIASRILYLNLGFARRVGVPFYNWVAHAMPSSMELVGEWIFAAALHGDDSNDDAFLHDILAAENRRWLEVDDGEPFLSTIVSDGLLRQFRRARRLAPAYVEECADAVLAHRPTLVGLTSLFQQQTASLALARCLKARDPALKLVLGGPNCEGLMGVETARRFRFLDAVVVGEGERVFPEIVARALDGRRLDELPGVYSPEAADAVVDDEPTGAPAVTAMDELPIPDHGDFDAQWEATELAGVYPTTLLFETARGCWWGQKHHCTFCGLNGNGMAFRSKSPERALAEYRQLAARYPGRDIATVDNILDMRYFDTFLSELGGTNEGNRLFYEVKSNLKREHVRILRDANVAWVQPGIESLSDQVLGLMQKGVSTLQNVQLLKWCQEFDVTPLWNIIWGFPGEEPDEYERMADLLPLLTHLCPPMGMGKVQVHRFSPNFFDAERLGYRGLRPADAYAHLHPFDDEALFNIAYFFDYDDASLGDVRDYTRRVSVEIRRWQDAYATSTLRLIDRGESMIVHDGRPGASTPLHFLSALERAILLACDELTSTTQIARSVAETLGAPPDPTNFDDAMTRLEQGGLLLRQSKRVLGLALLPTSDTAPAGRASPPTH